MGVVSDNDIKQAVAIHHVDPMILGRMVDNMRFKDRMNHPQVCAEILRVCPEVGDIAGVDALLYACDEAEGE